MTLTTAKLTPKSLKLARELAKRTGRRQYRVIEDALLVAVSSFASSQPDVIAAPRTRRERTA
jgi:hypothetical protein